MGSSPPPSPARPDRPAAAPGEDPLVAKAFDADKHAELAAAIEKLSPDEAQFFLDKLERAIRKRKIQITGYLVAMLVWAIGMFLGLVWYGTHDGFQGWVFLVPFLFVGAVLWAFGRWAERVGGPDAPRGERPAAAAPRVTDATPADKPAP